MDAFMRSKLAEFYMRDDGNMKEEGELIVRADLAATLDKIAEGGESAFYTGDIAGSIVEAVSCWCSGFCHNCNCHGYILLTCECPYLRHYVADNYLRHNVEDKMNLKAA